MSRNCLAGFSVAWAWLGCCEFVCFLYWSDVSDSRRWSVLFAIINFIERQDNMNVKHVTHNQNKEKYVAPIRKCRRSLPFAQPKDGTKDKQFRWKYFLRDAIHHRHTECRPLDGLFVAKKLLLLIFNSIINFSWSTSQSGGPCNGALFDFGYEVSVLHSLLLGWTRMRFEPFL